MFIEQDEKGNSTLLVDQIDDPKLKDVIAEGDEIVAINSRPVKDWLDENFILDNIKDKNPASILGPLANSQAFPRLYLVIIREFASIFNYNVLALRFFPLVSMFAAF